jgi:uncharacterized membrane protein HdeD (DUF308 family)
MLDLLKRNWWALGLRGLVAIIFGILAIIWPLLTVVTLIVLFGAFALVDGIFAIIAGISANGRNKTWWAMILGGIAGVIVGLLTFFWPGVTGIVLLYFIAAWAVVTGVFHIVAAIQLRQTIKGEWLIILNSIALIIYGLLLMILPGAGALSLVLLIGFYSIGIGILLIILTFRLRSMAHKAEKAVASPS